MWVMALHSCGLSRYDLHSYGLAMAYVVMALCSYGAVQPAGPKQVRRRVYIVMAYFPVMAYVAMA